MFEAHQFEFDMRQEQTIGILKTYIHPSILTFVETTQTPKQVIEALSKQFQPTSLAHFLTTIRQLFTLQKHSDQAISSYFTDINKLLFNKWVLAITLNGLTSNYNTVKAIIQDWSNVNLESARACI